MLLMLRDFRDFQRRLLLRRPDIMMPLRWVSVRAPAIITTQLFTDIDMIRARRII